MYIHYLSVFFTSINLITQLLEISSVPSSELNWCKRKRKKKKKIHFYRAISPIAIFSIFVTVRTINSCHLRHWLINMYPTTLSKNWIPRILYSILPANHSWLWDKQAFYGNKFFRDILLAKCRSSGDNCWEYIPKNQSEKRNSPLSKSSSVLKEMKRLTWRLQLLCFVVLIAFGPIY